MAPAPDLVGEPVTDVVVPDGYVTRFVRLRGQNDKWLVNPKLRPKLVAYAKREGVSMTTAAVMILAAELQMTYEPLKRKTTPSATADELNLRIPKGIDNRLDGEAWSRRMTVPDLIRSTLCKHFDLT